MFRFYFYNSDSVLRFNAKNFMMRRKEEVETYRSKLDRLKDQANQVLYYAEGEDLLKREDKKGSWNVVEVIHHLNLVNAHYLDQYPKDPEQLADASPETKVKTSLLGRMLIKGVAPGDLSSGPSFKMRSPASTDPLKRQKKGYATVDQVVFRDFTDDLKKLEHHLQWLTQKAYEKRRIKTLLPIFSINAGEALLLMIDHGLRHMNQAERIISK